MNKKINVSNQRVGAWRLNMGIGIIAVSIIIPLGGIPVVSLLGLSTAATASISGVLLIGAEVLGIIAIAVMGKDGYAFLKTFVASSFKQYGPPQTVSLRRYSIGLMLFIIPLLVGWLSPYIVHWFPFYSDSPIIFAIVGDICFLTSFIVLGGDFWDKIRSLFIHSAKAHFPQIPKESSEGKVAEGIYG